MPRDVDTSNQFAVSFRDGQIVVVDVGKLRHPITKEQAINLAAYLALMADPDMKEFQRVVNEIARQ